MKRLKSRADWAARCIAARNELRAVQKPTNEKNPSVPDAAIWL